MSNRTEQLKSLLIRALESASGIILRIRGGEASRRHSAIAALSATKRDLGADIPELLNIQIRPIPGDPDLIALQKYGDPPDME